MPYQILIVVDDPSIRQRYAETLETAAPPDGGTYQVVAVSIVTSALWYAARRRFDLVLIEEHLRGPLDALMRLLVDRNPGVRLIAIGVQAAMPRATQQRPGLRVVAPDCTATELRAIVRTLLTIAVAAGDAIVRSAMHRLLNRTKARTGCSY
jgi:DNA-binding NtrC family response regulator